jgi:transmembrane sensor
VTNASDPFEPPGRPDPLLLRIRDLLRARSAKMAIRPVAAARADLDARLQQAQLHDAHVRDVQTPADDRAAYQTAPDPSRHTGRTVPDGLGGWRRAAKRRPAQWMWAAGAMCAALVAGAVILFRPGAHDVERDVITHTYATATGQRATLKLSDGTVVTLAPQTVLRVAEFDARARRVMLDGEARFEVANVAGASFEVQTGTVNTRVLGTTFLVRRYAADRQTRVAVQSGKVLLAANSPQQPSVVLTAGHVGYVSDSSATEMVPDDIAPYTGWLDGRLVFHNAPTEEVLATLGRWYGYRFRLSDSTLAAKNLTAVLSTQSSRAALATLELLLNVDLAVDGTTVTLTPRRKPRTSAELRDLRYRRDGMTIHTSEVGR